MIQRDGNWEFHQPALETRPALKKVFAELDSAAESYIEELMDEAQRGRLSFDGLCEARYRGATAVAVFPQPLPGKAGILWVWRPASGYADVAVSRLVGMALDFFLARRARLVYALFPDVRPELESILSNHDFRFLAELHYLGCPSEEFPREEPDLGLEFEPISPSNWDRFARVVEETYLETLDCADLKDVRSIGDVLDGYQGIGSYSPERWFLVRHGGVDAGCLLLAKHCAQDALELVYMGILPKYRGRGFGRLVARYAQWVAGVSGVSRILLAVDSVNEPAVAMYASVGFRRWDRRRVLCKVFQSKG